MLSIINKVEIITIVIIINEAYTIDFFLWKHRKLLFPLYKKLKIFMKSCQDVNTMNSFWAYSAISQRFEDSQIVVVLALLTGEQVNTSYQIQDVRRLLWTIRGRILHSFTLKLYQSVSLNYFYVPFLHGSCGLKPKSPGQITEKPC